MNVPTAFAALQWPLHSDLKMAWAVTYVPNLNFLWQPWDSWLDRQELKQNFMHWKAQHLYVTSFWSWW